MFQLASRLRLAPRATAATTVIARPTAAAAARPFSSVPRLQIKEDADRSPEELEKTKQEQLEKQKRGEGHWHEELASAGEAGIAADKQKVHDHDQHMEELQKKTAGKAEKEHPESKA